MEHYFAQWINVLVKCTLITSEFCTYFYYYYLHLVKIKFLKSTK